MPSNFQYKIAVGINPDGTQKRKAFYGKTKREAKAKAEAFKETLIKGTAIERESTFAKWATSWLETYKKPSVSEDTYRLTYENSVRKHLIPYFGESLMTTIKPADVQKFLSVKGGKLSKSMVGKLVMCLNDIFETAIDNEICIKNPARKVSMPVCKPKIEKHFYNAGQAAILSEWAATRKPEVAVMVGTGLRRGELLGLKWEDISFANKTISVNRSLSGKRGGGAMERPPKWESYRQIPMERLVENVLISLPHTGEYVFTNSKGQPYSPNAWIKTYDKFMKDFCSEHLCMFRLCSHELRHTYGTVLRERKIDIYTIQKIMGHKDIKMTSEKYVHNDINVLKEAVGVK